MNGTRTAITHEDVQRALAAFRQQGGTITRLPDQVTPSTAPIGLREAGWEIDLTALAARDDVAPEGPLTVRDATPAGN